MGGVAGECRSLYIWICVREGEGRGGVRPMPGGELRGAAECV